MGEELLPSKYNDVLSTRCEKIKNNELPDIREGAEKLHSRV